MKKILATILFTLVIFIMTSCSGAGKTEPVIEDTVVETAIDDGKIVVDNAFYYTHINGNGKETPTLAFILFEYEQLETIKYQVAYLACTCRGAEVNYYSVAYIELSKEDGSISFISYDKDSSKHYTAGLYGDSTQTWDGTPAKELFAKFREDVLIGASQESINAFEPMHGDVDTYSGATVTPNNSITMLQSLFKHHNARYMN